MQSREVAIARNFFLVFNRGDEVITALRTFAEEKRIRAAYFVAVGAVEQASVGWWSWATKGYERVDFHEPLEVLSLIGNIAVENGRTKVHAHVSFGRRDGAAAGGHLFSATVTPTLEMHVMEYDDALMRRLDENMNLSVIVLN